jgi:acyl-CoA thioester hydrolase
MNARNMPDPFTSYGHIVKPEWIDAYDHMNMSKYVALFDDVAYDLLDRVGLGVASTRTTRRGLFVVDARVRFLKELRVGTPIEVSMRLVGVDHLRLQMWLELREEGSSVVSATQEQMGLHADLDKRKTLRFPEEVRTRLDEVVALHRAEAAHGARVLTMRCAEGAQPGN